MDLTTEALDILHLLLDNDAVFLGIIVHDCFPILEEGRDFTFLGCAADRIAGVHQQNCTRINQ